MADDAATRAGIEREVANFMRFDKDGTEAGITGLDNALANVNVDDEEIAYAYVVVAPSWGTPFVFDNFAAARKTVGHILRFFFPAFTPETIEQMLQDIPERSYKWETGRWQDTYVMYSRQQVRKNALLESPLQTMMRGPPTD